MIPILCSECGKPLRPEDKPDAHPGATMHPECCLQALAEHRGEQ